VTIRQIALLLVAVTCVSLSGPSTARLAAATRSDSGLAVGAVGSTGIQLSGLTKVSVSSAGSEGDDESGRTEKNIDGEQPEWSADGTRIAFTSFATDLGPQKVATAPNVYVRDLVAGRTELVNSDAAGTPGNGWSRHPALSPDGARIAFVSDSSNLVANAAIAHPELFIKDLRTGVVTVASATPAGTPAQGWSEFIGRYQRDVAWRGNDAVLFTSDAPNLVPPDVARHWAPGAHVDLVYLKDVSTGALTPIYDPSDALPESLNGLLSPNGRRIAFDAMNGEVKLFDLQTNIVTSVDSDGLNLTGAAWSPDGRRLALTRVTLASDSANVDEAMVYDTQGGLSAVFAPGERGSVGFDYAWSPDGNSLAFQFQVGNAGLGAYIFRVGSAEPPELVPGMSGGPAWSPDGSKLVGDGALLDLKTGKITALPWHFGERPGWSPDGRSIAFVSMPVWLQTGTSQRYDVYAAPSPLPGGSLASVTTTAPVRTCPSDYVIDSRGSGEDPGTISPPGAEFISALGSTLKERSIKQIANPYPARGGFSSLSGAKLKIPGAYFNSVNSGKIWLTAELAKLRDACPKAKVILTGYSQGAQVTADVVQHSSTGNVAAVVIFGDPYFNGRDPVDRGNPRFRKGVNGGLGERPRFTVLHVLSYCHSNDPVCQNTANPLHGFKFHENYQSNGEPQEAARVVAGWVK
jgi:hypothetical protein